MESGLEDRNNGPHHRGRSAMPTRLNGVRPRRPEQSDAVSMDIYEVLLVSMESGLEDRNNSSARMTARILGPVEVSMESGLEDRNNPQRRQPIRYRKGSQWSPA